ncbi:MAG: sulfatase, partial [Dermatophilaceae bacterium]
MRAIVVMFDSLNRLYLPPYGAPSGAGGIHAPNVERLAARAATFEQCYAGSMPCVPARRELHTGRYNFLHRSWGPLEPFDDSVPQLLREAGVHTHLATDHYHYWEDGGATYHNRFSTFEFFRGQEGDPWHGVVDPPDPPADGKPLPHQSFRQDLLNRSAMTEEADHCQTLTFDAGLRFLTRNAAADRWLLQIETFDPHEPFFTYDDYRKLYPHDYDGPHFDWPDIKLVTEDRETVEHLRAEYSALLSMCDRSLGRVLDTMDALDLWRDTMLIVCTDHGYLLGEHDWWGKLAPPWYEETIHTPLFIWDPRSQGAGVRRTSLVQTIDLGPTLLDWFGLEPTPDMQGHSLVDTLADDRPVREAALFGAFGGHVCATDGRWVYLRACATEGNQPLVEHTLMPTHMRSFFGADELSGATLGSPFGFTRGMPVLRIPATAPVDPSVFGTLLFDLEADPGQQRPLVDDDVELRMCELLVDLMRSSEAPAEQFERLGVPQHGPVGAEHLLVRRQWPQVLERARGRPDPTEFAAGDPGVHTPLADLLADPRAATILRRHQPALVDGVVPQVAGHLSLYEATAYASGVMTT